MTDLRIIMDKNDSLREQINKTEMILAESRENLLNNQGSYSARLLLISIENHLEDLLRQLSDEEAKLNRFHSESHKMLIL